MLVAQNTPASYEICYENSLKIDCTLSVVYSTGFRLEIDGVNDEKTYYFEDDTKGKIYLFYLNEFNEKVITDKEFGFVDYEKGEVMIGQDRPVTIIATSISDVIVEVRAIPREQGVVAKQKVYMDFDVSKSTIDAIVDTEIGGS